MSVDFEKQLTDVAAIIKPDYTLAPETIPIAADCLEEIDQNYGPSAETPLSFHNAEHSLGVSRRAVRLANILYPYIHQRRQPKIFDLAIIAGSAHDMKQGFGPGANERYSARAAMERVREADGVLNTDTFTSRLFHAVLATAVTVGENGELIQNNLLRGSHDPIKLIMAFGDINGIAMEGNKRMWLDATNVYYETTQEPTGEGLYEFLARQKYFLRQRLNDGRIKSEIAYYFPNDIEAVYRDMHTAFHSNITSAFGLTLTLKERPELQASVEQVVNRVAGRDKPKVGSLIGKAIRKKLLHISNRKN